MDTRLAERLFVLVTSNMDRTCEEERNTVMDVFLEEKSDVGELKRMLLYLLDKAKTDRREMVKERIEQQIDSLHEQQLTDSARPPCFLFYGKYAVLVASVKWRSDMKKFIRLCGIAACTLLFLTGCNSGYERDSKPGRVKNITVAEMREMVNRKESFTIVLTQTTCPHCIELKKMLDGCLLDHNVVLYDVVLDEAPVSRRESDLNTIQKAFLGVNETPPFCYAREGKLENLLENGDGGLTGEKLDNWVQRYKLDEKE